jgi:hypothetical protein
MAAIVVIARGRSKRLQEKADIAKSFHQDGQAPGMFNRWTSKWKQNVAADSQAQSQGYNFQYPGQAIGATFNRWTARLSQYRPGGNNAQGQVYNQEPASSQVGSDYYASNPVMTQEYNASGLMSSGNPQYNSPSNGHGGYAPAGF